MVFLVSLVWMDKVWSSRGPEDKGAAGNYWFWVWAGPTIAGALFPERSRPQCGPADSSPERSDSEGCSPGAASPASWSACSTAPAMDGADETPPRGAAGRKGPLYFPGERRGRRVSH